MFSKLQQKVFLRWFGRERFEKLEDKEKRPFYWYPTKAKRGGKENARSYQEYLTSYRRFIYDSNSEQEKRKKVKLNKKEEDWDETMQIEDNKNDETDVFSILTTPITDVNVISTYEWTESCTDLMNADASFFFQVLLYKYKPLEVFFLSLQRAKLVYGTLDIEIENILQAFFKIYDMKMRIFTHLAQDIQILKSCAGQLGLTKFFPKNLLSNHDCQSFHAKVLKTRIPIEDIGCEEWKESCYFALGIWEAYLLNVQNPSFPNPANFKELLNYVKDVFKSTQPDIWDILSDSQELLHLYQDFRASYSFLPEEIPNSCKELLLQMKEHELLKVQYKIALCGTDDKKKEKIFSWFKSSTTCTKQDPYCYLLDYKRGDAPIYIYLYSISTDHFRVCDFDMIIHTSEIKLPSFSAFFKHLVRFNIYSENEYDEACLTSVEFSKFNSNDDYLVWKILDYITDVTYHAFHNFNFA